MFLLIMTMKRIMMTTQNMQNKSSILPQPISTKQKVSTDYHVIILCLGQFFKLKNCIFVCISRFLFYLNILQSTLNLIWGAHPTQIKAYAQYRTFFWRKSHFSFVQNCTFFVLRPLCKAVLGVARRASPKSGRQVQEPWQTCDDHP